MKSTLLITCTIATGIILSGLTVQDRPKLEAPALTTPSVDMKAGFPTPAKTGSLPVSGSVASFDATRALPYPTKKELSGAGERIAACRRQLSALPFIISPQQADELIPELKSKQVWVADGDWTISQRGKSGFWSKSHGRMEVHMGATLIKTTLARIRERERNYVQYLESFSDDYECVFPVASSYQLGATGADSWSSLEVFSRSKGEFGCPPHDSHLHVLEHWIGPHLVVEYYDSDADSKWMAGRDTYLRVEDQGSFVGFLVVTEFGFDIDDCWEGAGHIDTAIQDNLTYTKKAEE